MKINRMIGLLVFLAIGQFLLRDIFAATSRSIVATMGMVEVASESMAHTFVERAK